MGALTGRPCKCCQSPNREKIDAAILADLPFRNIAESFAISQWTVRRHAGAHVASAAMREAARAVVVADTARAGTITAQVIDLHATAMRILAKAEAAGDLRTALAGVREAARCVELVAKLVGELDESASVNVTLAPAFITVQGAILTALAPYPEARIAVTRALERIA